MKFRLTSNEPFPKACLADGKKKHFMCELHVSASYYTSCEFDKLFVNVFKDA